jgi:glycosyltransferase involved in cell wall biosynthesis
MNLIVRANEGVELLPRVNLHLYTVALQNDSRFVKQARSILKAGLADEVLLVGKTNKDEPLAERIGDNIRLVRFKTRLNPLPKCKLFGCLKYAEFVIRHYLMAKAIRPSVIQCHSVSSLPAAALVRSFTRVPLIYDARELETESNGLHGLNQVFTRLLERALIRHCDAVLCVSESIADWYVNEYGIERPFVVRNVPDLPPQSGNTGSDVFRLRFKIPDVALIFVYSGGLLEGRRVEQMIRVFGTMRPDRHLVFMGFGPLEGVVKEASSKHPNIHFLPAVPPSEVLGHVAGANVGIVGVENNCLSYHLSLPNKLFEYLLAGIPFLAPDYPEMRRVLETHKCGWLVGETDDQWRAVIETLDQERTSARRELVLAARRAFSWEQEAKNLLGAYQRAAGKSGFRLAA